MVLVLGGLRGDVVAGWSGGWRGVLGMQRKVVRG